MSKHFTVEELFPSEQRTFLGFDVVTYATSLIRELDAGSITIESAIAEWRAITYGSEAPPSFAQAAADHQRRRDLRNKFKSGDRVRFTTRFLRDTGCAHDDGDKVWTVVSQIGDFVHVNEPSLLGANCGHRRINAFNLEHTK